MEKSPNRDPAFWYKIEAMMYRLMQIAPNFDRGIRQIGARTFADLGWWIGEIKRESPSQFLWSLKCNAAGERLDRDIPQIKDGCLRLVCTVPDGRTFADFTDNDTDIFVHQTGIAFVLDILQDLDEIEFFHHPNQITIRLRPVDNQVNEHQPVIAESDSAVDTADDLE